MPLVYQDFTGSPDDARRLVSDHREAIWLAVGGAGSIGWYDDQAALIARQPLSGPGVGAPIELTPTSRPVDPSAPLAVEHGVVALRWFEVAPGAFGEFVELSTEAWPVFESVNDATVLGLFRADADGPDLTVALLATRYGSLAEWERSRQTVRATEGEAAEAGRRFQRRRQLTRRSVVRVGRSL
ncbi:MAG TPA: hypothetical protein VE990_05965 [Acidimicrobiales bacterium]|nr:hypothetical protein [Acidimicrobiales bacterium]